MVRVTCDSHGAVCMRGGAFPLLAKSMVSQTDRDLAPKGRIDYVTYTERRAAHRSVVQLSSICSNFASATASLSSNFFCVSANNCLARDLSSRMVWRATCCAACIHGVLERPCSEVAIELRKINESSNTCH